MKRRSAFETLAGTTPGLLARTAIDYAAALMKDGTKESKTPAASLVRRADHRRAGKHGLSRRAAGLTT